MNTLLRQPNCKYCGNPVEKVRNRVKKDLGAVCRKCRNVVYRNTCKNIAKSYNKDINLSGRFQDNL
jgi:hypothetical protein